MIDGKEEKSADIFGCGRWADRSSQVGVDSQEPNGKGRPRVRGALADSIRIAQMVVEEITARQ